MNKGLEIGLAAHPQGVYIVAPKQAAALPQYAAFWDRAKAIEHAQSIDGVCVVQRKGERIKICPVN